MAGKYWELKSTSCEVAEAEKCWSMGQFLSRPSHSGRSLAQLWLGRPSPSAQKAQTAGGVSQSWSNMVPLGPSVKGSWLQSYLCRLSLSNSILLARLATHCKNLPAGCFLLPLSYKHHLFLSTKNPNPELCGNQA